MSKLIISASSTLTNKLTSKPKFEVETNPNMMPASKEKAPVLLSIASAGTVEADEFAERFAGKCSHIDAVEAVRRINALGEVLAECAAEGINVQLGYMNLEVSVSGTIPDTNAALNEANEAFYSAVPSEKIRKQFATIETHIPTTVCPADVKRVRDVATGDGSIHRTDPFFIQGVNITLDGVGEKSELFDEKGETKVCDVEVLDATSKVSVKAKLSDLVEPGRYYLLVTTLAGGDSTLYPIGIPVTVKSDVGPGPKLTRLHSTKLGTDGEIKFEGGDTLEIDGASFTEDAALKFELYNPEGALVCDMPYTRGNALERVSDKKLVYTFVENTSPQPDGLWTDPTYVKKIKVITAAGEATMEIEAK